MTRDQYTLLKHASGLKGNTVLPFLNFDSSCPESEREELQTLITEELQEFMTPAEVSNLVTGSASDLDDVNRVIDEVIGVYDFNEISEKRKISSDLPLFWPLENVGNIPNRGTFLAGRIQSGSMKKGDKINILQVRTIPNFLL